MYIKRGTIYSILLQCTVSHSPVELMLLFFFEQKLLKLVPFEFDTVIQCVGCIL